ncbi:hypothetical protein ACP8HI_21405 [Paenibacillus sp. FA6]|uniref:hypothetical protein n=1 Tax=Paenibacillus sp. FA6 TaxID=3413029 RepID=UPI003F656FD9
MTGGSHSLVLTNSREVYSFSRNYDGQLGHGDDRDAYYIPTKMVRLSDVQAIAAGGNH